jgi:hypothetical protein
MTRLGAEILGGLTAGNNSVEAAAALDMRRRQQQELEAQQVLQLFRERAARTYNMGRFQALSKPPTPETMGAASQTMEAFANLPASMQEREVQRMEEQARLQENMDLVRPVLESLRKDGLEAEAADIEYRVRNGMPVPQWSGSHKLKKKAEWTPEQVTSMLPGLQNADLWANKMNTGETSFNDAQQQANRSSGGLRPPNLRMVDVNVTRDTDGAPEPQRVQVPYGGGMPMPPHIMEMMRGLAEDLVIPVGMDVARDGVFYDTQQTEETFRQAVDAKLRDLARKSGWTLPTSPAAPGGAGGGSVEQRVNDLIGRGITDRARIKRIIKGEEPWPAN